MNAKMLWAYALWYKGSLVTDSILRVHVRCIVRQKLLEISARFIPSPRGEEVDNPPLEVVSMMEVCCPMKLLCDLRPCPLCITTKEKKKSNARVLVMGKMYLWVLTWASHTQKEDFKANITHSRWEMFIGAIATRGLMGKRRALRPSNWIGRNHMEQETSYNHIYISAWGILPHLFHKKVKSSICENYDVITTIHRTDSSNQVSCSDISKLV